MKKTNGCTMHETFCNVASIEFLANPFNTTAAKMTVMEDVQFRKTDLQLTAFQ